VRQERKPKKEKRRVAQDERGFYGFIVIVTGGTIAVLLSILA